MARKPPPSAVLKTLPDEVQAEIYDALQTQTIVQGVAWLAEEKGIKTNKSSLGDWRGWYETTQQISSWENDANDFKALLIRTGTDDELAAKIAEARFLAQATKQNDAETFVKVMGVIEKYKARKAGEKAHADNLGIKARQLKQRDRQLEIQKADLDRRNKELQIRLDELERQRKAAEEAITKANKDGGMTDETVKIIRRAMGMSDEEPAKS